MQRYKTTERRKAIWQDPSKKPRYCVGGGEDTRRFEEEMQRVDNLSAEERKAYREKLRKQCEEFRRKVIIKI